MPRVTAANISFFAKTRMRKMMQHLVAYATPAIGTIQSSSIH
jgi:hypothetical protein